MGNKSKEDSPRFKIFRKFKGYGYIDKTGKEVIPCRFYDADFDKGVFREGLVFYEGLAWVKRDKKYGYIDKSGKEVIPCKYDDILYHEPGYFSEGLAEVRLDDFHWAWIDKKGKEVVVFDH